MNMFMVIGIILGILASVMLLCIGVIWVEKHYPSEEYDERQKQAQGNASRLGFITGMLYFAVIAVILLRQVDGKKTVEPWLLVFIGVLLMVMVDHTYCFLTQAALPLSQKPMTSIIGYGLMGAVQILYVAGEVKRFPLAFVGHGTGGWIHLLAGILSMYLALMHLIQYLRDRKERHG